MEFKRKYNIKIFKKKNKREKKSSVAEGKQKHFFFCYSVLLYSHLFLGELFVEIPKLVRHKETMSYEVSTSRYKVI